MTQENNPLPERLPLVAGALFGAVAFVWGYLLTVVMVALAETEDFRSHLVETSGWMFYNAHLADIKILDSFRFNFLADSTTIDATVDLQLPAIVYHLVPIFSLLLAGFGLARYAGSETSQDGAIAGGLIFVGTLPLSIVGWFLFRVEWLGVETAPILTESILFVGIVFPLLFGAAGGVVSTRL